MNLEVLVEEASAKVALEVLANAGHQGVTKTELARRVAEKMNVEANRSHSFRVFRDGIRARVAPPSAP